MRPNNIFKILLMVGFAIMSVVACKKEQGPPSIEQIKYNSNKNTYKLDSAEVIQKITKQKVQEVLDLATLYSSGNKDTEIDSVMYDQILGYFFKPDSTTLKKLFSELDSLQVKQSKLSSFEVFESYVGKDTLNFAKFGVEYYDKSNRKLADKEHIAQYVLVPKEIKFKKEFKFYFINFYNNPLKDSISSGVTK